MNSTDPQSTSFMARPFSRRTRSGTRPSVILPASSRLFAPQGGVRLAGTALVTLLALVLTLGCADQDRETDPIVMTVGGENYHLGEFEKAFWAHLVEQEVAADSTVVRDFVPVFIDRALLEAIAEAEMPELPTGPAQRVADVHERAMIEALHRKEFGEARKVSRQHVERAYELLGRRLKLRYIFVHDLEEAERIVGALKEGAAFGPVAQLQSKDEKSRDAGGDLGWMDYYDLSLSVRDKVFSLPVGEIGGPYAWGEGYQIFKVEEERANPARGTLEAERVRIEADITAAAVSQARRAFEEALLRKYNYSINPIEVTWMTAFLRDKTSMLRRIGDPDIENTDDIYEARSRVPWTSNPIPEADRDRVLATIAVPDGRINPVLVLDQLVTRPSIGWPRFEDNRDVEELLRQIALIWLEPREAMAQGLDTDPLVLKEVREREREIRRRFFYRSQVRRAVRASAEEALAYYEANPDLYRQPERRRFIAVGSTSWDNAVQAAEMLRSGFSAEDVRSRLAPEDASLNVLGGRGTPLFEYGRSPALDDVLFRLPLNGVSDPIPVGQSFTVAKVVEIQPEGLQPFEGVRDDIQLMLTESRADSVLQALLDERGPDFPVEINWDNVMKVRLEAPRAGVL